MGLFQKKILPVVVPKYSLGHQETLLIVGLGNMGKMHQNTRHNTGFLAIDAFASQEEFGPWTEKKDLKAILCAKIIEGRKVILCKPTTMMNLSGEAVLAVQQFYKLSSSKTLVIYDELDLDYGTIRANSGGQDAGHNGVKSIISKVENTFWRIRVGIGPKTPPEMDTADYVLQKMNDSNKSVLNNVLKEVASLTHEWISGSIGTETRKV